MTPEVLVTLTFLVGAAALLFALLQTGRHLDEIDPRIGQILYEDVAKPELRDLATESIEAGELDLPKVDTLRYVDNHFAAAPDGEPMTVTLSLQGKADRVIQKRDGSIHIIDYKSGTSARPAVGVETKLPDKFDYYRFQIMAYFLMWAQSRGNRPTRGLIDFVDGVQDYITFDNTEEIRKECFDLIRELVEVKLGAIPEDLLLELRRESEFHG